MECFCTNMKKVAWMNMSITPSALLHKEHKSQIAGYYFLTLSHPAEIGNPQPPTKKIFFECRLVD